MMSERGRRLGRSSSQGVDALLGRNEGWKWGASSFSLNVGVGSLGRC